MNTISLSILLLLNYICLKEFGFYGAAIGTLITTLISFITWYFLMRKIIDLDLSSVLKHIISTYRLFYQQVKGLFSRKQKNKGPEQGI
jgi:O-antigen/teichoic acid export membrane protein